MGRQQEKVSNSDGQPIISIIMPVYNTASYLKDSISSVLDQTFSSFELILIDDGSTDESRKICETSCRKDNRVRLLPSGGHKGCSCARNMGIEAAAGEYICFHDSDDRMHPQLLECMWKEAEKTQGDLIMVNHWISDALSSKTWDRLCKRPVNPEWELCKGDQIWGTKYAPGQGGTVWSKLFLKEAVSDLRFAEEVERSEDWLFIYQFLTEKPRLLAVSDCKAYYHIEKPDGLSHQATLDEFLASMRVKQYVRDQETETGRMENALWAEQKIVSCIRDWLLINSKDSPDGRKKLLTLMHDGEGKSPMYKELSFYQKFLLFLSIHALPVFRILKTARYQSARFLNSFRRKV